MNISFNRIVSIALITGATITCDTALAGLILEDGFLFGNSRAFFDPSLPITALHSGGGSVNRDFNQLFNNPVDLTSRATVDGAPVIESRIFGNLSHTLAADGKNQFDIQAISEARRFSGTEHLFARAPEDQFSASVLHNAYIEMGYRFSIDTSQTVSINILDQISQNLNDVFFGVSLRRGDQSSLQNEDILCQHSNRSTNLSPGAFNTGQLYPDSFSGSSCLGFSDVLDPGDYSVHILSQSYYDYDEPSDVTAPWLGDKVHGGSISMVLADSDDGGGSSNVPVPASIWLMLTGIGVLRLKRKR